MSIAAPILCFSSTGARMDRDDPFSRSLSPPKEHLKFDFLDGFAELFQEMEKFLINFFTFTRQFDQSFAVADVTLKSGVQLDVFVQAASGGVCRWIAPGLTRSQAPL